MASTLEINLRIEVHNNATVVSFLPAIVFGTMDLNSQLSESYLPLAHKGVRLEFKGKGIQDPLPSVCRTPINW